MLTKSFFRGALEYEPLNCIYSGQILDPENISLDHYLPWSFVAHDQIWNLVPVLPQINSSKSNNLPSDIYFYKFVEAHHQLLLTHNEYFPNKFKQELDSYISDLRLPNKDDLLDRQKLINAYNSTLKPLAILAEKQGFSSGWSYLS